MRKIFEIFRGIATEQAIEDTTSVLSGYTRDAHGRMIADDGTVIEREEVDADEND